MESHAHIKEHQAAVQHVSRGYLQRGGLGGVWGEWLSGRSGSLMNLAENRKQMQSDG